MEKCEARRIKICTSKSVAMVLGLKRGDCPLLVGGEPLPQVEEIKYLGVLFIRKLEREINNSLSAVMWLLYWPVGQMDRQ